MELTELGRDGPQVSRVGLGLMGMSGVYGPAKESESVATILAAIEAAVPSNAVAGDRYDAGGMASLDSERH